MQTRWEDRQTSSWLKDNGLSDQCLQTLDTDALRALQVCYHALTNPTLALTGTQRRRLKHYRRTLLNRQTRHTITQAKTYAVLNIGTQLNRQLFRQYRQAAETQADKTQAQADQTQAQKRR